MKYDNNMSFDYFTSLSSNNLIPYISTPTRITDTSATLNDHIFTKLSPKHFSAVILAGNLISDLSDHLPNFLIWQDTSCAPSNNRPLTILLYYKIYANFDNTLIQSIGIISSWEKTRTPLAKHFTTRWTVLSVAVSPSEIIEKEVQR